jgi:hypothetical protein
MPMSNIYYWSHSLDNPEPEGLEEEPYIHDEYIVDNPNYLKQVNHLRDLLTTYCTLSRSCNEPQVMGRAQGGDKLPHACEGGWGLKRATAGYESPALAPSLPPSLPPATGTACSSSVVASSVTW